MLYLMREIAAFHGDKPLALAAQMNLAGSQL